MPANLPPSYHEAEQRFRTAKTTRDKIEALEEMLTVMPKHKGTDRLRADLRKKISKLRNQPQKKGGPSKRETVYAIDREGAAQAALIGPPNTGKSSLVDVLTNASPEVADFPHSTWKPLSAMVPYENIQFQLIDTPPITREFFDPGLGDLIRRCDILILMLDLHADPLRQSEEILSMLQELRVFPEGFPVPQDLKKSPFLKKTMVVVNKMDSQEDQEDYNIFLELWDRTLPCLGVSARTGLNLDRFGRMLFELAGIIRVYTKAPGKDADLDQPFVLAKESNLENLAAKIHKDFLSNLKFARVWGRSTFDGQMVQRDHILEDGDIVEIHA